MRKRALEKDRLRIAPALNRKASRGISIQAKPVIGAANSRFEEEADRMGAAYVSESKTESAVAEPVKLMRFNPSKLQPKIQRKENAKREEEADDGTKIPLPLNPNKPGVIRITDIVREEGKPAKFNIQRKAMNATKAGVSDHFSSQLEQKTGGGQALPSSTKNNMESFFGSNFSQVRIHTDTEAVQMSQDIGAQAFTYGSDIFFNSGKFDPNSDSGKSLLAHELTHVVQQTNPSEKAGSKSENKISKKEISQIDKKEIQLIRDCDQEHLDCWPACWRRRPPWPIDFHKSGHYRYCTSLCLAEYMACLSSNAAERTFHAVRDAAQWVVDNPGAVIGTIVVVAGVVYIVAQTGGGALILIPAL